MNQLSSPTAALADPTWSAAACCPPAAAEPDRSSTGRAPLALANPDPAGYVRHHADGSDEVGLIVEDADCGACLVEIEDALRQINGVTRARVNLALRRLSVAWNPAQLTAADIAVALSRLGYRATPYDPSLLDRLADDEDRRLLRAMAVAGFAGANIMLLSVSVWAGHDGSMLDSTRALFHWLSALIAIPVVAYSGRPFFRSAARALAAGRVNMDVPISLGVLLAVGASVFETVRNGQHAYFDAAVMLLFFLLIGRYLDQRLRARARDIAGNVLALRGIAATVIAADGSRHAVPAAELTPGMRVAIAAGDRIPADGVIAAGRADIDESILTGESRARTADSGHEVYAGTLCLNGALELRVARPERTSLIAEIGRLMETAGQHRSAYTRLADRWARGYAPTVHVLAAGTYAAWLAVGAGWHTALMCAIAVLIITCPCALGLAVPAVQVVAVGRLLKQGLIVKAGDALERLAEVDSVVLDKTGTVTSGELALIDDGGAAPALLAAAAGAATGSRHPLARALVRAVPTRRAVSDVREVAGCGIEALVDGRRLRVGSRAWCAASGRADDACSELWLAWDGAAPVRLRFADTMRADAGALVARLQSAGLSVELLSGDHDAAVAAAARATAVSDYRAGVRPAEKISRLSELAGAGRKVLMVGDGLNDAPALAAAHVSLSPATAADVSQSAADIILLGAGIAPIGDAIVTARLARRRMVENFALAIAYNMIAVPIAMLGLATPLVAAVAMSGSSLIVSLNALRLGRAARSADRSAP